MGRGARPSLGRDTNAATSMSTDHIGATNLAEESLREETASLNKDVEQCLAISKEHVSLTTRDLAVAPDNLLPGAHIPRMKQQEHKPTKSVQHEPKLNARAYSIHLRGRWWRRVTLPTL